MEFRFNVNIYLTKEISRINNNLLPEGFSGDRRAAGNWSAKIAEMLDEMGLASAKAQGLSKPITSAERLRNSNQLVYLLKDHDSNKGQGSVVGMLKMGWKNLFVFDERGITHEKMSLCVLDFYVHESKQRVGCGKRLFDYMLADENIDPQHLAIDKPSEKFLAFLYKHYGLGKILPQSNNFVLYEGFFDSPRPDMELGQENSFHSSSNTSNSKPPKHTLTSKGQPMGNGLFQFGRHSAYKPPATIGKNLSWSNNNSSAPALFNELRLMPPAPLFITTCHRYHDNEHLDIKFQHSPLW